jgi:response regulator RpfG family c-di-GMP phosphodiesterase
MNADPIYQQHSILFIDDEVQSQKYFSQIFGKIFKVHLASDGEKGLALFREHRHEIGVVVSDQRMPGMAGSELLAEIAKENADVVKILSTAYSDLEAAIDAVNEGGIYRYVTKPWDLAELEVTLRRAMDFFQLKEQHRSLARMKIAGLEQMFHQSRLLACIAIPALIVKNPSAVRAFRDVLRLSLDLDDHSPQSKFSHIESLTRKARQKLAEQVQTQLARLLEITDQLSAPGSEDLENLSELLNKATSDGQRPPLVEALLLLLQGEGEDADLNSLASLLIAYQTGYEIQRGESSWCLAQTSSDVAESSTFEDLYDLFVDDAYLVSLVLGELR